MVKGGRFLQAYRKLSERIHAAEDARESVGTGGAPGAGGARRAVRSGAGAAPSATAAATATPLDHGCGAPLASWDHHAFCYVLGGEADVALEIAAALSQFEPVTVCVGHLAEWRRVKRSVPDHIRVVCVPGAPLRWSQIPPVAFVSGPSGDARLVDFSGAQGTAVDSVTAQIAELERLYRYVGPALPMSGESEAGFLDVDGAGRVRFDPALSRRPDALRAFGKGLADVVPHDKCRLAPGAVLVPRGTLKASMDVLEQAVGKVFRLNHKYMGFYAANNGVLVAAYGNEENDTAALTVIKHLFPGRRVVQIHTTAENLNINAYALGFCGSKEQAKPGSSFNRLRAARAEHAVNEVVQLKAQLEERLAQATQAQAEAARLAASHRAHQALEGQGSAGQGSARLASGAVEPLLEGQGSSSDRLASGTLKQLEGQGSSPTRLISGAFKPLSVAASPTAAAAPAAASAAASFKAASAGAAQTSPEAYESGAAAPGSPTAAPAPVRTLTAAGLTVPALTVPTLTVPTLTAPTHALAAGDSKRKVGAPIAEGSHTATAHYEQEHSQDEEEEHDKGDEAVESQSKPYDPPVQYSPLLAEPDDNFKLSKAPETPSGIMSAVKGAARRVTVSLRKASIQQR